METIPTNVNTTLPSLIDQFRQSCTRILRIVTGTEPILLSSVKQLDTVIHDHKEMNLSLINSIISINANPISSLVLASLTDAVQLSVTHAKLLLDYLSSYNNKHNSHIYYHHNQHISLAVLKVLDSIRDIVQPHHLCLYQDLPNTSSLYLRHIQRQVSIFIHCYTEFAKAVYTAVNYQLPTITWDSEQPTSLFNSTTTTLGNQQSFTQLHNDDHEYKQYTNSDTTTQLLTELDSFIRTQLELQQQHLSYIKQMEMKLDTINKIDKKINDESGTNLVNNTIDQTPVLPIETQMTNEMNIISRSNMTTDPIPTSSKHILAVPNQIQDYLTSTGLSPSIPNRSSLHKYPRSQYTYDQTRINQPILESYNKNTYRHRYTITQVDLTDRTEKVCRICNKNFRFIEKRIVCKDCRLTIHKDCYKTGQCERVKCDKSNNSLVDQDIYSLISLNNSSSSSSSSLLSSWLNTNVYTCKI